MANVPGVRKSGMPTPQKKKRTSPICVCVRWIKQQGKREQEQKQRKNVCQTSCVCGKWGCTRGCVIVRVGIYHEI